MMNIVHNLGKFSDDCHEAAKDWWINLDTGEQLDRNVGELLALVHSEISEAYEGWSSNSMDQHLPERCSIEVELADVMVRIGDLNRGKNLGVEHAFWPVRESEDAFELNTPIQSDFNEMHVGVSHALEGYRKNKMDDEHKQFKQLTVGLARTIVYTEVIAHKLSLDIDDAIHEKMAYNAQREDHKIKNRVKNGGKKI